MTEEELERRARKLCEMRGLDPEKRSCRFEDLDIVREEWRWAADELRAWDQCRRVMEEPVAERALQRGDRVNGPAGASRGTVLGFVTKSNGTPLAVVEWADGSCGAWSVHKLERIS